MLMMLYVSLTTGKRKERNDIIGENKRPLKEKKKKKKRGSQVVMIRTENKERKGIQRLTMVKGFPGSQGGTDSRQKEGATKHWRTRIREKCLKRLIKGR